MDEEKDNLYLADDIEYIIIQNEKTGEIIAKINPNESEVIEPYIVRVKPIPSKKTRKKSSK